MGANNGQPAYIAVGGIIIDDIVLPDGETRMAVLGGGVVHGAAGMRLWDQRPGLVACVGRDLPDSVWQRLAREFDTQGVVWLEIPQARAWQIFEWDGRRTEIFRVAELDPFLYEPGPDHVPPVYDAGKGVHLLRDAASVPAWRARFPGAALLWEPIQLYMVPENRAGFRATLAQVDIVSPNLLEASALYGFDDPARLVQTMLADGAPVVALRMGERGSLVGAQGDGTLLEVPAVPVPHIVDQTGAGNTYCGGFLVGWLQTGSLLEAACYGAVASSFALEVTGVATVPADLPTTRAERYRWLRDRIVRRNV